MYGAGGGYARGGDLNAARVLDVPMPLRNGEDRGPLVFGLRTSYCLIGNRGDGVASEQQGSSR